MIKSMTGFGRCVDLVNEINVTAEIKSVNHRYFECFIKVPRIYGIEDTF